MDGVVLFWMFLAIFSALVSVFSGSAQRAIQALWLCGISVGGVFIGVGLEFLGVVQWLVSSLLGLCFIVYAVMFGAQEKKKDWSKLLVAVLICGFFLGAIWICLPEFRVLEVRAQSGGGLVAFGQTLIEEHLLSIQLLGLTLFLAVVGAGVVARPEVTRK